MPRSGTNMRINLQRSVGAAGSMIGLGKRVTLRHEAGDNHAFTRPPL